MEDGKIAMLIILPHKQTMNIFKLESSQILWQSKKSIIYFVMSIQMESFYKVNRLMDWWRLAQSN